LHQCIFVITGSKREAQPAGIVFTHGPIFGFSPAGATRRTDQGEIWQGGADLSFLPNFTLIGSGLWVYGP